MACMREGIKLCTQHAVKQVLVQIHLSAQALIVIDHFLNLRQLRRLAMR